MWIENDSMMDILHSPFYDGVPRSLECPSCGEHHVHVLMHRHDADTSKGTAWIWCDACHGYAHLACKIPIWWENPPFLDEEKLDSTVEYPNSICKEVDAWMVTCLKARC